MVREIKLSNTVIKVFLLSFIFVMLFSVNVFAGTGGNSNNSSNSNNSNNSQNDDSTLITKQTADDVAKQAMGSIKPILVAFGGVCVFAGIAMIGFKLIFAHNNPDKRISAMSGLLYIGIGAFLLGACTLVAGFFWGLGS